MLQTLSIQNLALIEKLTLEFDKGFTTLTGETGAGKSILLDALGLAIGNRADSSLVRHGNERANVAANFDIRHLPFVQDWLKEHELDDDDQCLLRRTVTSEGRSGAYINGQACSVSQLKTLSSLLIDIHGQHEHQALLKTEKQLELLDLFAQHKKPLKEVAQHFQVWQYAQKKYQDFLDNQTDRQARIELLSFQKNEFDELLPLENEFETLSEEQQGLAHANEIITACQTAYQALEEEGASHALQQAIDQLQTIINYQPDLAPALTQLESMLIDTQEIASDIQGKSNHIEVDPARLAAVDDRLAELYGLAKKYQLQPNELTQKHNAIKEELAQLLEAGSDLTTLLEQVESYKATYDASANILSKSRQKAAKKLCKMIMESMKVLGMENGIFEIQFETIKPTKFGNDAITLLVSTNKGQPPQSLAKVASGGELSRISLAIQVATAEVASLPTMIFDEVDVGIGGGIAEVVGQKMQEIGQHRQVFSITHLPQVASFGEQHLFIEKHVKKDQTYTQVRALEKKVRVEEIARMLGGMTITEQTLNHAKEMLENAQR